MVVVSGSWVKNVATYPTPDSDDDMVIPTTNNNNVNNNNMSAKAVLICRPNSHPFQDRTLCLNQPVKIGRSIARARATSTNAIFDCKVLSRHHALLWYDCGKFFLQDTKSSNGTFVNNNRLSTSESEPHEVSSGDIVQFGVDVVENNRKVTHGCIIATLKLYLPDGKEAKASPSITEANRHGLVPLDELYKLNQIIQEATQREQCLETKLTALQNVVEEARRSADESWQVFIGEERLLSRVATLESQLLQAGKNWGDERLREELSKLQEDRNVYQVAAKDALRKLHAERLEAVATATTQERARISSEQEALLIKEQLSQAQDELQDVAQKLSEEQKKVDEQKAQMEQRERELQSRLEAEIQLVNELQMKMEKLGLLTSHGDVDKSKFIYNDLKAKEEMLAENDRTNGIAEPQKNHISLTVVPVSDNECESAHLDLENSPEKKASPLKDRQSTVVENDLDECEKTEENAKESVNVLFRVPECAKDSEETLHIETETETKSEATQQQSDAVDSKTLKYQFQTAQDELKRQIEKLKQLNDCNQLRIDELERNLSEEKSVGSMRATECDDLKQELVVLQQKCKESCNENRQLHDRVSGLASELAETESRMKALAETASPSRLSVTPPHSLVSYEHLAAVEEELILLKERYAQVNEEKTALNKKLTTLRNQYNMVCNRSYNHMFFYIAPLVLMVLYLLISSMFS